VRLMRMRYSELADRVAASWGEAAWAGALAPHQVTPPAWPRRTPSASGFLMPTTPLVRFPSMLRSSFWSIVAWITPNALLGIQDRGMAPVRGFTEVKRRKGQITRAQLREWWPHHVVLSADKVKGLRNSTTVHDFANTLSVAPRTYWLRRDDGEFVVFCFAKPEDADAFCERFVGERVAVNPQRPH
jgi:hypothetical protein